MRNEQGWIRLGFRSMVCINERDKRVRKREICLYTDGVISHI